MKPCEEGVLCRNCGRRLRRPGTIEPKSRTGWWHAGGVDDFKGCDPTPVPLADGLMMVFREEAVDG